MMPMSSQAKSVSVVAPLLKFAEPPETTQPVVELLQVSTPASPPTGATNTDVILTDSGTLSRPKFGVVPFRAFFAVTVAVNLAAAVVELPAVTKVAPLKLVASGLGKLSLVRLMFETVKWSGLA